MESGDIKENDKPSSKIDNYCIQCANTNGMKDSTTKCRICLADEGNLISPCLCKGSVGFVHKNCLETWLENRNVDSCELCQTPFHVIRIPKKFREWWQSNDSLKNRKILRRDLIVICAATFLGILSVFICLEKMAMAIVSSFLIICFFHQLFATLRRRYRSYKRWKNNHSNVQLLTECLR
ncbi:E3 ubiquitin-protein ligase MARCH2-like [Centruroides sculpturatus]|uniref:E3 ubiquitin-protein ligase MARCH2-like n=1 Tax=Centruroides sculpturatus TaxID=218467 RepID=UPI000C6D6D63|nr:E3 ubiquitin-protein ligase MARCH2-like [Centruroides sculpturatus]XP_023218509.1 E3 ubiquitin-protein ligase MARCH2-like [Centruroides sculpturatus]XP_023218511.1 E3 ubiquitin-protein ligase MARCH2-like [Centruroides sculpturatus]